MRALILLPLLLCGCDPSVETQQPVTLPDGTQVECYRYNNGWDRIHYIYVAPGKTTATDNWRQGKTNRATVTIQPEKE